MASARCPECDELVSITPTGQRQHPERGTSTWWRVADHPSAVELKVMSDGSIVEIQVRCPGSGRKV